MIRTRGDTIVEVTIAFAVFALVVVTVSALMGRGMGIAQQSLETTLVRQQIDAQADMLRFARDEDLDVWSREILSPDNIVTTPISVDDTLASRCEQAPNGSYFLTTVGSGSSAQLRMVPIEPDRYKVPATFSHIEDETTHGLWIQTVLAEGDTVKAYDFYIRACWYTPSSDDVPMTIATIVRLYDNR